MAYNGHIYLAALAAVEKMANVVGDAATFAAAAAARQLGSLKLTMATSAGGPLWDGEKQFWRCHSNTTTQIFTDSCYGQMLSHNILQNFTVAEHFIEKHLEYEWKRNQVNSSRRIVCTVCLTDVRSSQTRTSTA